MTRGILASFILVLAMLSFTSKSWAGDVVIPEAWAGVWNLTNTTRLCGMTGGIVEVEPDTLCAGEAFFAPDPDQPVPDCTGTVTDTEVNLTCTSIQKLPEPPGCVVTATFNIQATRTGDTYTATDTFSIDYSVPCGVPDSCRETVTTAVRSGNDPDCTVAPVEPATWSMIKSAYR